MKKVNDKLNQISKLATEQHVADTINSYPLGSPTSSASSTGTLKGDETSEPIPVTSLESNLKEIVSPREATTVKVEKTRSTALSHGGSNRNEEKEHNRSTSFEDKSTANTLGRYGSTKSEEKEGRRSTSSENVQKSSSPRPEKNPKDDIASLDPKTLASLKRFEEFKSRKKELEPHSPEPTRRDRTAHLFSSKREAAPVDKGETQSTIVSPDSDSNGRTPNLSPTPLTNNKSPVASRSDAPEPKVQPPAFAKTPSPDLKRKERECPVTPNRQQSSETDSKPLVRKEEVGAKAEEKTTLQQENEKASEEQQKEGDHDKLEEARRERERMREERRRARKEEERKREEERQRLREEERKRMELERERTKEMRRREREKQAQRKSGSSSSSESLVKFSDQRKWAWSVEARTSTTQPNGVRLFSQRSEEPTEETKLEQPTVVKKETERQSPPQSSRTSPAFKSERTKSSEFFQFCTDYTLKNNVKQHKESPKSSKTTQKQVAESLNLKSSRGDKDVGSSLPPGGENSPCPSSPMVVLSPPPTHSPTPTKSPSPELRRPRERSHRERSPAADNQKPKKEDWRKTPVITTDAIDSILKGDIDEVSDCLHYANEPNTKRLSQLETFPEEDETPESTPRGKSPTPIIREDKVGDSNSNGRRYLAERRDGVLPSSFKNPNRPISPEKRVTLLAAKERTQSVDIVTPEGGESPSPSPDTFIKSFDAKRTDSPPKPEGVSRLTISSSYSSLSRSTPDLSEIAGSPKKHKQARKAERSHSRRMGGARMDSYITSTDSTSSYYQSPASPHIRSGRHHGTLPARLVGGSIFSKWDFKK